MSERAEPPHSTITHRRVLAIAIPIVISNVTQPLLGAVDTGVVGQLGSATPIGAVGIGAMILSGLFWIFGFLRMGTTGLTSQALGASDHGEVAALLTRALMIAGAGGLLLIALQWPLFALALQISPGSAEVETLARDYMAIRIWSAPAAIATYGISGWLIGQERTRAVLLLQLWMNGLNILLDIWFVLGLGWGVEGVAVATLIAEISGALFGLWLCRAAFGVPDWRNWTRVLDRARLKNMALVNSDILLRSILLLAILQSFLLYGAKFGDVTLAANQILIQFMFFTAYALDGFAFAAEALVGQAFGRGDRPAFRRSALIATIWGMAINLVLTLVFFLAGGAIIDIMATAPEVRLEARHFLPYAALMPIMGLAAWMLDGIFIGATRTRDMRNMMLVSSVIYLVALALLIPAFGNHGLWLAFLVSFIARGVTLGLRYPALERSVG